MSDGYLFNVAKLSIILAVLFIGATAHAHPLGTRLWGHRMQVMPKADAIQIDYTIEVPITKLALMMNRFKSIHGLESLRPPDEAKFNEDFTDHLQKGLSIRIDDTDANLIWNPNYSRQHGNGDEGFFEYRLHLISPMDIDGSDSHKVEISNANFPVQRAVFFNEIINSKGAYASKSSVESEAGWEQDEKNRHVSFEYRRGPPPGDVLSTSPSPHETRDTAFRSTLVTYLRHEDPTAGIIAIALALSIFLGAVHALSPGHGKAIVAAYLVGSQGTVRHAIALGLIVTLTHIASVVILGTVGLILARYIVPEYYAPFISLVSGTAIVCIGIWLFVRRIRVRRSHGHAHEDDHKTDTPIPRQLLLLGISGGIVPCPSAMAVMLSAIAIGRIALGFAIVAFFSVGLAIVLILIGITTVKTSSILNRIPRSERILKYLPIMSAAAVMLLGLLIIYYGFWVEWTFIHQ